MPQTKSAEQEIKVSRKRCERNKSIKTRCKSSVASAEQMIFTGDLEASKEAVAKAASALDKAAAKGTIHPNNVARRKSRLMKKLNQAQKK